ncbi:DUF4179 domain-containing protein [Alkalihalobacillus deserti]|uniref:DUF4179 domain-containing protein n=1 Tax=Alkalihalobacillus deserti TaxID=2879466 RepID=UPI001D14555D|nr:DUF4179 domain-containing protein [Alkalihalobacillus deserti]
MNDKIKKELQKIEIPTELRERSKLGIWKAKSEQQKRKFKQPLAVAAIILGLSIAMVGFVFPAMASNIPLISNIYKFLGEELGINEEYQENSTEINMAQENNGIKVTINEAVFDGQTVMITYSVESEHDLGDEPLILNLPNILDEDAHGLAGGSIIKKVGGNEYVGLMTVSHLSEKYLNSANIHWEIESFTIVNGEQNNEIEGNWNFEFNLEATESQTRLIGQSVENEGIQLSIEEMSETPMSFILHYEQKLTVNVQNNWHYIVIDLEVKDDLGNEYSGVKNGGFGSDSHQIWSKTFEKIQPNATKLIVTPHVTFKKDNEREDIMLDDIVIDLN